MRGKPYEEMVAQAARAVAGLRDAELQHVAFERILNDMLPTKGRTRRRGGQGARKPAATRVPALAKKAAGPSRRGH